MTTANEESALEAVFKKYWRRWVALKCIDILVILVVIGAYSSMMLGMIGYGGVGRNAAAIPFAIVVVVGMLFLVGRPWSFTAYLDRIIEKTKHEDARIAKKYLSRQSILASFRQLELAMRQQDANVLQRADRAQTSEHSA
jgi:hypothetical protein